MLLEKIETNISVESIYDSSNLIKTIYSPDRNLMYVIFANGVAYSYYPINKELYNEFETNTSQGKFFIDKIKNNKTITMKKGFKMETKELNELKDKIDRLKITKK